MKDLKKAIRLRNNGKRKAALKIFQQLIKKFPQNALIHYHCGWTYDSLGMERQAVPHYEEALTGRLSDDDRKGAFIGLGSSYRCIGKYKKSLIILNQAIKEFPKSQVLHIFRAICLCNLGKHDKAVEILLRQLTEATNDPEILAYRRAILFYSDNLKSVC